MIFDRTQAIETVQSRLPGVPVNLRRNWAAEIVDALASLPVTVDDATVERAARALDLPAEMGCACPWDEDGNPPPDCRCGERRLAERQRIARAALLAALTPEQTEEGSDSA